MKFSFDTKLNSIAEKVEAGERLFEIGFDIFNEIF